MIAFIDELHRFNKSQQDALLPHVEDGTIALIGATTENPYYEINSPLLSRMRVYRLNPLDTDALGEIVDRGLAEAERGLAGRVRLSDDARATLIDLAGGDARGALNILEAAAAVVDDGAEIVPEGVAEAAQQRLLAYDRVGDQHYEAASAFIKSMRGNDPDAALYWCASMVAAGEDPTFIARRIVIAASEDVGNADPRALQLAVAAMQATEMIGLPEAQYALAQAAAYVAAAPKSEPGRSRLLCRAGRSRGARAPAGAAPPAAVVPSAAVPRAGLWEGVPLPARLRGCRCRPGVHAGRPDRARVLRALRGGAGAQDRRAAAAAPPAAPRVEAEGQGQRAEVI